jgi:tetratricopeptide (TPR) repeat protein
MKRISLRGSLTHVVMAIILLVSFVGTGCAPKQLKQEEIMAREQARLQAEAHARGAEEAKRQAEARQKEKETAFVNEAKRYREMPVKPALPEDVQRYRVMAEDAFNNKDFEKALEYYRKGLAIEPLWPQGQYNAAMLAGELHWYDWAALYMKHYLELVPDAANAKAAREKMYLWEGKAKEGASELSTDGRFIAYDNGTVLDTKTNLMWAAKDNGSNINWAGAKSYCWNYRGGGYTDWHMPTQDELAGLHDAAKTYKTACGFNAHLTELIQLSCSFLWASETRGSDVAGFDFGVGRWDWYRPSDGKNSRALPVRSGK